MGPQAPGCKLVLILAATGLSVAACTVAGHVENAVSGEPITGAEVILYGNSRHIFKTSADGAFSFDKVKPDHYFLDGYHENYVNTADDLIEADRLLQVTPECNVHPVLKLRPKARIFGKVTSDDGKALPGVAVSVLQRRIYFDGSVQWIPKNSVWTDAEGNYSLRVKPATLYLYAEYDSRRPHRLAQVAPIGASVRVGSVFNSEQRLSISAGSESRMDLTIPISKGGTITGRLSSTVQFRKPHAVILYRSDPPILFEASSQTLVHQGAEFAFQGLLPGSFDIQFEDVDEISLKKYCARAKISITGTETKSISVAPTEALPIRARVIVEPSADVQPDFQLNYQSGLRVNDGRLVVFPAACPAPTSLTVSRRPPVYLKRLRLGGRNVPRRFDVTKSRDLEVVFGTDVARVHAELIDQPPYPARTELALIQEEVDENSSVRPSFWSGEANAERIAPGRYYAFASERLILQRLASEKEFFERHRDQAVIVDAVANGNHRITLKLLRPDLTH